MKRKPRIYYTDEQKALMWERWRQGESLQHIAQLFDEVTVQFTEFLFAAVGLVLLSALAPDWL
jgi:hypothetical protein